MSDEPNHTRTRFAPSPTGALHLGNARTALFNWLYARRHGGAFVVRSEDTDRERSDERQLGALLDVLRWLGLDWDEGPDAGGPYAPYRQSGRMALYQVHLDRLLADDHAYPCFCTRDELEAARQAQRAAGRPPRYSGTCAQLSVEEREARRAQGREPTLRFRVPDQGVVTFNDLVRGEQQFQLADIGDFVIARADGTPAFFFANVVDDALMAISHVLRGEDHLANTPRQLLILRALSLDAPAYAHFALIAGDDGRPLSKRHGAASLNDLQVAGYRPEAVVNHLVRLGYTPESSEAMVLEEIGATFDLSRAGRAVARHDSQSLDAWQRRAVERLDDQSLWEWLQSERPPQAPELPVAGTEFARVVRANMERPADAWSWAWKLFAREAGPDAEAAREIAAAGPPFFRAALEVSNPDPREDFTAWARAVGSATGTRGKSLFRPLRAALTGTVHGPELRDVVPLMPADLVRERLQAAAAD